MQSGQDKSSPGLAESDDNCPSPPMTTEEAYDDNAHPSPLMMGSNDGSFSSPLLGDSSALKGNDDASSFKEKDDAGKKKKRLSSKDSASASFFSCTSKSPVSLEHGSFPKVRGTVELS